MEKMEKYDKIRAVGRGAYGTVYLCRRLIDKKLVIIKQIPVEQMTKDERQAALNEVKVLSMLDHPNIIRYYENFLEDKALMIVMEYAEGGTVFEYLQQRNGRLLEEEEILKFFAQMLLSLQHVHSKQILHRDLKTQNILLDKKKEAVKIGDFGISKVLLSKSKAYTVVGTPCYISPELCEGKPYNQKSDIWALGCVLYELTTLKRAFEAQTLPALILKIMRGTFAPISEHYSDSLRQLILDMLHIDPNKRPTISQIMAQPMILDVILTIYTDFGKIPCRRITMSGTSRGRLGRSSQAAASAPHKPQDVSNMHQSTSKQEITEKGTSNSSAVYCWGGNLTVPVRLPLPNVDTQVTEVSAGRTQKAAVTKNGRLLLWESPACVSEADCAGANDSAHVAFIPRFLEGQSAVTIQHVSCGDLFTACVTDRGILMTFGSGAYGCLGHGNYNDVTQARIVEALLGCEIVKISCGVSHVLAITNEHEVFAWGLGENGRLGLGSQTSFCAPQQVSIDSQFKPADVFCGVDCSVILCLGGKLLCCGNNRYNKLALNNPDTLLTVEDSHTFSPALTPPIANVEVLTASVGTSHAAVATVHGECYTFGSNQFGQLGIGCTDSQPQSHAVHKVNELQTKYIVRVACGDAYTVAVSNDGEVFSWGKRLRGRLGRTGKTDCLPAVVTFSDCEKLDVLSLSCSHGTTLLAARPL